jgi:hypothetical protein
MEKRILKRKCHALGHRECYYQPAGEGRATSGGNVRKNNITLIEKYYKRK